VPDFDISVVKAATAMEEFRVTADDEETAKKVALELAGKTQFEHGVPECIIDLCLEVKEENEDGHT